MFKHKKQLVALVFAAVMALAIAAPAKLDAAAPWPPITTINVNGHSTLAVEISNTTDYEYYQIAYLYKNQCILLCNLPPQFRVIVPIYINLTVGVPTAGVTTTQEAHDAIEARANLLFGGLPWPLVP